MIPLKRSVEENKVSLFLFKRPLYFIPIFILNILLLYSFSRIKTIERLREYISSQKRELLFSVWTWCRFRNRRRLFWAFSCAREHRDKGNVTLITGLRAHTLNIKNIIRNNARLLLTERFDDQIEKKTERSTTRTKILRMKSLTKVDSRAIFPARTTSKMVQRTTPPCDRTATAP